MLAATSFAQSSRASPTTRSADDAALEAARSYKKLWRRPRSIRPYGESSETAYNTLIGLFPNSPLIQTGKKELADLEEMFAQKNYLSGMYYLRRRRTTRRSSTSRTSSRSIPTTPSARMAQLRLVDAYKAIRYKDDAADQCAELRRSFPDDAEVKYDLCRRRAAAWLPRPPPRRRATPPPTALHH